MPHSGRHNMIDDDTVYSSTEMKFTNYYEAEKMSLVITEIILLSKY